jgi:SAM-dependent methyltransferase
MDFKVNDRSWINAFYDSAAEWWGESWYEGENLEPRLDQVKRLAGEPPKRLLELGAGTGETAAYIAAAGYAVTAVDLREKNYAFIKKVSSRYPDVTAIRGDFLTMEISEKFDAVCLFEAFGLGTDFDQRNLLKRIACDWLTPEAVAILDVYLPYDPIKISGTSQSLERLEGIPGSVDMTERSLFDPVLGRWIDEWEPLCNPATARRQPIRCYTPADLLLLLEGTGPGDRSHGSCDCQGGIPDAEV